MDEKERRRLVTRLYGEGASLADIGRELGTTREWARRLVNTYGVPTRPRAERLYDTAFPARGQEVEELFLQLRDDDAVAAKTGIDRRSVTRYINETLPDPNVLRRKRVAGSERYSDEEMAACLQEAAKELGTPLAHARYAEWSRNRVLTSQRPWPGPQGMMLRFGSWRNALARAGLPAHPTGGPDPTFELSDAVDAMVLAWQETGRPPTAASYDLWRARREEFPVNATARKFVDGWGALQLAAWPLVHGRQLPGVGSQDASSNGEDPAAPASAGGPYRPADEKPDLPASDPFERDPQQLERSLASHGALQNTLSSLARDAGYEPLSPVALDPEFDVAWRLRDETFVLVEVKSATASNLEGQLRIGLGQLLRYGQTLRDRGESVRHILAVELPPADVGWLDLLRRLDVQLVTPDNLDDAFG